MEKRLIVFSGNCQAASLRELYKECIAPLRNERVSWVNKSRTNIQDIREADVVFEQVFGANDPDISRELKQSAVHIRFPHVAAMFLWPSAGDPHPRNREDEKNPAKPGGPYPAELGDRFLDALIRKSDGPRDAIKAYRELDVVRRARLDRLFEIHLEQQRTRDRIAGIPVADAVAARFRQQRLFTTRGHLTMPLFTEMAMAVLPRAGIDPEIVAQAVSSLESVPYPETEAPLHPGIIEHFGLTFVSEETRYRYGPLGSLSPDEWWHRYLTYDWNRTLHEGLLASRLGQTDLALQLIQEGLSESPSSSAGWRCQCRLLQRLDRLDEAETAARRAAELDSILPDGSVELAYVLLRRKQNDAAEKVARGALERCPVHRRAHFALANALGAQDRLDEAISTMEQLLRLAPGNAMARQRLASLLDQAGLDQAGQRGAAAARPGDAANGEHALVLAQTLVKSGKAEEAEGVLRQALLAGSERVGLHGLLADVLAQRGELDAAVRHAELEVRPGERLEPAHTRLTRLLLQAGRCAEAEASARRGLSKLPESVNLKRQLANSLYRQKRYAEALRMFEDVAGDGREDAPLRARIEHLRAQV